jgi:hypothetical protein
MRACVGKRAQTPPKQTRRDVGDLAAMGAVSGALFPSFPLSIFHVPVDCSERETRDQYDSAQRPGTAAINTNTFWSSHSYTLTEYAQYDNVHPALFVPPDIFPTSWPGL